MYKEVFESHSLEDNLEIAEQILATCKSKKIFGFYGDLGAGKTTLIKTLCKVLNVEEEVNSPTFTFIHEYEGGGEPVYHFDFYRIRSEAEAYELGLEEYFDSGSYCFVEWPEKIASLFQPLEEIAQIRIELQANNTRTIEVIC